MAEVSVEKRFRGSVRLVTLLLWRMGESTDVSVGFAEALGKGMITDDHVSFIRKCMDLDERMDRGEELGEPITIELVDELQACALRLNSADPA